MSTFDQAGTSPIVSTPRRAISSESRSPLSPTAVTMPASLASIAGDVERVCSIVTAIVPADLGPLTGTDHELLTNSATALLQITEQASAALGVLARAGIKPLAPSIPEPTR